jgi:hypothetical protein
MLAIDLRNRIGGAPVSNTDIQPELNNADDELLNQGWLWRI